ncbi:hypothetical protein [Shewanella gaetbuli]|uniref:DUF1579 domain-containing protein n=1 Tax=Shewanella gaetbuli TaxID=220752 RepID=A0A9X2CL34_9GAMM|nr:hypothetical protein [Shewanella gaetbuli]MCL1143731.1 hypothetical protein [Shewanella gaetbuli]
MALNAAPTSQPETKAPSINPKLAVFAPYLGTWEADFAVPEGKSPMKDVSLWERALNGNAIRTLHSINDGMYGGESLIFFDNKKQQLVFYYFTTAEFFTQGTIEVIDDNTFVAYEEVSGNDDGITKVKSTSTLLGNEMSISTSYFKKGQWTTPEKRTYKPSKLAVKFK